MNKSPAATKEQVTLNKLAAVLVLFCSCLLFWDYMLPGFFVETPITAFDVYTSRVRGSATSTYNIVTPQYHFPVSIAFISDLDVGDTISLEASRMLKIVNAYGLKNEKPTCIYFTRYLTGLFFPLILIPLSLFSLRLRASSANTIHLLLALQAMALFIFIMTLVNISNLF